MKRFWLVLLSLGLIVAFSTAAMAVDVKFSGEYYAAGMYLDRTSLQKDVGSSTAFYYQRLRVKTDFAVTPGLTLITRFDAMERAWGATRSGVAATARSVDSAGTDAENENIAFDWAYISYKSPIGVFDVGYMNYGTTGTIFGNNTATQGRIKYTYTTGPFTISPAISKVTEKSRTVQNPTGVADADNDVYHLLGVYKWKSGLAGLNVNYYNSAATRNTTQYRRTYFLFTPYVVAKIGPVALQGEFNYATGKDKYETTPATNDQDIDSISGWVDATADFGMFYAGGSIAYVMGDVDSTDDKVKNVLNGGNDWNPCLIMWNYDRSNWAGSLAGYDNVVTAANNGRMTNGWFFQARGGVRPVEKLDIMASVSYAFADKKPRVVGVEYTNDNYGIEADLTATYKITSNLSYMLGVGYLFTGDYYKGTNDGNNPDNDFLVINKLTLTF